MFGQHLIAEYVQVAVGDEADFLPVEAEDVLRADASEAVGNAGKRDVVRQAAFQTEHQRVKRTVPSPRQCERAVNVDGDVGGLRVQACGKGGGGLHRADRMRTRRADTDFENIVD